MKTVKEYICKLDSRKLVDIFFETYGERLYELYWFNTPEYVAEANIDSDESVHDLSVYDYAQAERKKIYDLIKHLQKIDITPIPDGRTGIIYAYGKYDVDLYKRWQARLVFKDELLADPENCKNRIFSAVKFSEVLGYLVADNKYTQDKIYDVIAFVMRWSTMTGFYQENNERFYESYKKHNGKDFEFYEPINEDFLYHISDDPTMININETAESQKRLNDIRKAIREYEIFTMLREREILVRRLGGKA